MNIAFLFPGQDTQTPGFLHRLPEHSKVTATLAKAGAVLVRDTLKLDTEAALRSTASVQLEGLMQGAQVRALNAKGAEADAVAGLSSGANTSAVACGALSFAAAHQRELRTQLMKQAYPAGHGLLALVGLGEGLKRSQDYSLSEVITRRVLTVSDHLSTYGN
jgi:malonate decarboxylase epsilon subunit